VPLERLHKADSGDSPSSVDNEWCPVTLLFLFSPSPATIIGFETYI